MAGDLRLGIRLTADSKGFVGEVKVARRGLDKLGAGVRKAGGANAQYAYTARRLTTCIKNSLSIGGLNRFAGSLAPVAAGGLYCNGEEVGGPSPVGAGTSDRADARALPVGALCAQTAGPSLFPIPLCSGYG